jgi:hypothetical protein
MHTGPGAGPLLAAAAGWDAVAAELESTASGYSSEVSALIGAWFGPSSITMTTAAAPYVAWLQASAAQAAQTAAQAYAAAAAYEAAFAMTVPWVIARRPIIIPIRPCRNVRAGRRNYFAAQGFRPARIPDAQQWARAHPRAADRSGLGCGLGRRHQDTGRPRQPPAGLGLQLEG